MEKNSHGTVNQKTGIGSQESLPTVIICNSEKDLDNHNKKPWTYPCEDCNKKFTTIHALDIHKLRHLAKDEMPFKCPACNFRAGRKADLEKHAVKHGPRNLACLYCDKTFHTNVQCQNHIKDLHRPSTIFQCGQCNFSTSRRNVLRSHLMRHEQGCAVVSCPLCDKTFQYKSNFKAHLLSHTGDKLFACDECGKKFKLRNRVTAHKQLVHREKTHRCAECSKTFATQHHLERHSRVHSGVRPFKCCFCKFDSTTQSNLLKHIRSIHSKAHFTYQDVLKEEGRAKSRISEDRMVTLKKKGKQIVKSFLKNRNASTTEVSITIKDLEKQAKTNTAKKITFNGKQDDHAESTQGVTRGKIINGIPVGMSSPRKESAAHTSNQYYLQLPENFYNLECLQKNPDLDQRCFEAIAIKSKQADNTPITQEHSDDINLSEHGVSVHHRVDGTFESLLFDEDTRFSEIVLFVDEESNF